MKRTVVLTLVLVIQGFVIAGEQENSLVYTVGEEFFEGYHRAVEDARGLVILVHDWDGLTDYERKRADMLAGEGYEVVAADLFGKGNRPTSMEEKKRLTGQLYADRARMRALLNGAIRAARDKGAAVDNAVAVGYCFGGTAVLELARSGAVLKGFVAFHGGLITPEDQDYSATKGTVLVFHGSADKNVSLDEFAALAGQLESAGVPHEMTTYGNAPHAFTVFGSDRYREDADTKSWSRFLEYLEATLD